ncbi:MAG TPA: RDD family protein [Candidatus Limnocylindrales bacterium]|nr:RDD family protein [Candidatus Limnocylindrales bacterium]
MTCSYCGSRNGEGEHRCRRCGRRPDDTIAGEPALHRTNGALAAQLQPQTGVALEDAPLPARPSARPLNLRNPVQRSLFQERSSNVIPFETYAPAPAKKAARQPSAKPAGSRPAARRSRVPEGQASLDFLPASAPQPRKLGTTVDAVIYCEAPVAHTMHRAVAAILDWSMVFLGFGMFLAIYFAAGGAIPGTRTGLLELASALPILGCAYGLIFTIAGAETPGMHWTHLRLTTFDGFQPDAKQRALRFAGSCLSLCTVAGLLWSLADEESLAWQDHMSGTFPTPKALDNQIFRRR